MLLSRSIKQGRFASAKRSCFVFANSANLSSAKSARRRAGIHVRLSKIGIARINWTTRVGATAFVGLCLTLLLAMNWAGSGEANAQSFGWLNFGPTNGDSGPTYSTNPTDPEFVREWEANPPKGFGTLAKANVEATKMAIRQYLMIVSKGGWPQLPEPPAKTPRDSLMQFGMTDANVAILRARLAASGDLRGGNSNSTYFDADVDGALKRFQSSNGLAPTGIADKRTIVALNIPADVRLKQLKANLTRLQEVIPTTSKKYVVVNIPAAQIEAVENGAIVARYAGVVGKADRPTPLLHTPITDLSFNPTWRLPPTVISEDLIPRGQEMQKKGQNVLVKFGIDAYDGTGKRVDPTKINWENVKPGTYRYSQKPGKENPLGFLKINFDSAHSVYMHDTPSDRIFGRNFRSESSGCIRVHNIENLATWLLAGQNSWDAAKVGEMKESGRPLDVKLKKPVQLLFVYISAWATEDGVVQFRRDIYQKDGVGEVAAAY
jgi:L,D-transpeptidase YcbB